MKSLFSSSVSHKRRISPIQPCAYIYKNKRWRKKKRTLSIAAKKNSVKSTQSACISCASKRAAYNKTGRESRGNVVSSCMAARRLQQQQLHKRAHCSRTSKQPLALGRVSRSRAADASHDEESQTCSMLPCAALRLPDSPLEIRPRCAEVHRYIICTALRNIGNWTDGEERSASGDRMDWRARKSTHAHVRIMSTWWTFGSIAERLTRRVLFV